MHTVYYWLSGMLLALMAALILEGIFGLDLLWAWLIAINAIAFTFYRVDKLNATWAGENEQRSEQNLRVPEWALLLLALAGGSPAAMLAVVIPPRHKSRDDWFLFRFFLVLAVQVVALIWLRGQNLQF